MTKKSCNFKSNHIGIETCHHVVQCYASSFKSNHIGIETCTRNWCYVRYLSFKSNHIGIETPEHTFCISFYISLNRTI